MNSEVQKKPFSFTSKKVVIISLVTFTLLMLAIAAQLSYVMLVYDKVYKGVYINELYVGGMDKAKLTDTLKQEYTDKISSSVVTLKAGNTSKDISFNELYVSYDIKNIVDKAYSAGRTGSIFDRLRDISVISKETLKLNLTVNYDKDRLEGVINDFYSKTFVDVKNPELKIEADKITLITGHKGKNFDKTQAASKVQELLIKPGKAAIDLEVIETLPSKINLDEYYNTLNIEPKNAEVKVVNGAITYVEPIPGRTIDKAVLASIIADIETKESASTVLPVALAKPELDVNAVKAMVFKDTLQTYSTQFYTGNQNDYNRGENIKLAVSEINGTILGPGETFSFNDVVGQRTEERGFKVAHAYSDGKVIDDVGGGICQVSSTLYNAAVFSDMSITDRTNHMFTVGYIPLGQDAAVSFGAPDLKFTNNSNWPVRIDGWVTKDNMLYFSLKGTNETPGKDIELEHKYVKTLDFKTKYTDDPNMAEGESYVKQYGATGYVIDTYKITRQNGEVVKEEKLYTSTYSPLTQEIVRGTKKQN